MTNRAGSPGHRPAIFCWGVGWEGKLAGRGRSPVLELFVKTSYTSAIAGFGLAISLGVLISGCAHQNEAVNRQNQEQYLTGSYLPQDTQTNGPITNGKNNVKVWDQSDLSRSGGATPGQALRQLGGTP